MLEAESLLLRAVMWRHSTKLVISEPLRCVGSRYYRKENLCDQFFTKSNDTEWVHNREPERSRETVVRLFHKGAALLVAH